jgi:hypothetical protein
MAMARKVIIFDVNKVARAASAPRGAVTPALSVGYWLVTRQKARAIEFPREKD